MRTVKIVADSSANVPVLAPIAFAAVPLKIITNEKEFVDDATLDVAGMVGWFDSYETICRKIEEYKQQTGLIFMLVSLKNFCRQWQGLPCYCQGRRRFRHPRGGQSQRSGNVSAHQQMPG